MRATNAEVLARRGPRHPVDPRRAIAVVDEHEARYGEEPIRVTTLLLTASECPLRCAMCDLWQNTLAEPTPPGAIPHQIEQALADRPRSGWIKLYNSGSFFDPQSIPPSDYAAIAALCDGFERVIVENHPRFGRTRIEPFARQLSGQLEIAVGLESVQPGLLRRLNKRMTRSDFDRFARQLAAAEIDLRVFLMLRPPWSEEVEAMRWTLLSVKHAVAYGARHVSLIPARDGNGWMEAARRDGLFRPPSAVSFETVFDEALTFVRRHAAKTIVTVDLWDWERLADCPHCAAPRRQRLAAMNRSQTRLPPVRCRCQAGEAR
jgi:radical SAM enzyme (TIGR01210 family)